MPSPLDSHLVAALSPDIELVGATAYAERPIGTLSGGEQQRLLIAQALVRDPELLLLDEPLDSLDLPNQSAVAALVQRICRERAVTVVLVAHDVNPILGYLDRVVYFAGGRGVEGPPREVIRADVLSRLYGSTIEVVETPSGRLIAGRDSSVRRTKSRFFSCRQSSDDRFLLPPRQRDRAPLRILPPSS